MLRFTKMHGLGNDFIVIDAVRQSLTLDADLVRRLADRHFGIGCDQLLVVAPAESADADFRYRIFNADGSEVAQCGNGARCFARFVYEHGLSDKAEMRVETAAGQLILTREFDGEITVNMGIPRHAPQEIPMDLMEEAPSYRVEAGGRAWEFGAVSLGNPHAVLRVEDVANAPVSTVGPLLESHRLFPQRANIGFMEVEDTGSIRLRVFERGAGETLACGSGACAAVVVGLERGWLKSPVQAHLPGGSLTIRWAGRGEPVFMTGPAVTVFEGAIQI